jgi:hypothetical protein
LSPIPPALPDKTIVRLAARPADFAGRPSTSTYVINQRAPSEQTRDLPLQ